MRAAILSIGDELSLGQTLDTNSQWLSAKLAEESIITIEHRTVADDCAAIATAIRDLISRVDVVVISGGLGPTADDLTREALGSVFTPGQELVIDVQALKHIESIFARRGRSMPAMNRKQAMHPATMHMLPNPNGTAPGMMGTISIGGRSATVFSLPGPPREMRPMLVDFVLPSLRNAMRELNDQDAVVIRTAAVQEFGMGESIAAEKLGAMMDRDRNPLVGTTASASIVAARIRADGPRAWADTQLKSTIEFIERLWHPYAFAKGDGTLSLAVGELLRSRRETLATAESCTGGWLGKMIVDVPGSSAWYLGGWITYSNAMKTSTIDVPSSMIDQHGVVSEPVALAMADGARRRSNANWALSITGIAGPDGGTPQKPVGLVWIGISGSGTDASSQSTARCFQFPGEREVVRDRAAKAALQMLRFALIDADDAPMLWELPAQRHRKMSADPSKRIGSAAAP